MRASGLAVSFYVLTTLSLAAVPSGASGSSPVTRASANPGRATAPERDVNGRPTRGPAGQPIVYREPAGPGALAARAPARAGELPPRPETDALFARTWLWSVMGDGIGLGGFDITDLDVDGALELVLTASSQGFGAPNYWYVLEHSAAGYGQAWSSPRFTDPIGGLAVAQVDAGGAQEIVVASGSSLRVYAGATRELLRTLATATGAPSALAVGDVDADGSTEAVLLDASDLFVYDLTTGVLEQQKFGFGGVAVDLGQADDDAALEIAVANLDQPGFVLDGATRLVQWGRAAGLGFRVRFANLDADLHDELVAGWFWTDGIYAFDIDTDTELWHLPVFNLDALFAADVDGAPGDEVTYGDAQWGGIHILQGSDGAELWQVDSPEHGVTNIATGDGDGDGVLELYWGAGYSSTGPDILYAADTISHVREWESQDVRGPFHGLAPADLDGDGIPELLAGSDSTNSGYDDGIVLAFDPRQQELLRVGDPPTGHNWTGLWRIGSANLDADPQDEFCIGTSYSYTGKIICYDGSTWEEQWHVDLPDGLTIRSLAIADVDGDGPLDLVAGVYREHTGAPGDYVYSFEGGTGWLKWRTPDLGFFWCDFAYLRVGEVDGDSPPEVVVGDTGAHLFVLDGATGTVQGGPWDLPVTALALADLDGNLVDEIYVGLADATIDRVDPTTGGATPVLTGLGEPAGSLAVTDLDLDLAPEFLFAAGGTAHARPVSGDPEIWQSGFLGNGAGEYDGVLVADVDGDDLPDVTIDSLVGFAFFGTAPGASFLFADGFETGDTSRWSQGPVMERPAAHSRLLQRI